MPKKIIICADGTWNTENQADQGTPCPTNVVKVARSLLPEDAKGVSQVVYYHSGVGTNIGQRIGGGAFGAGLFANVRDCYRFLMHNYAPGDRLYFFGLVGVPSPPAAWLDWFATAVSFVVAMKIRKTRPSSITGITAMPRLLIRRS